MLESRFQTKVRRPPAKPANRLYKNERPLPKPQKKMKLLLIAALFLFILFAKEIEIKFVEVHVKSTASMIDSFKGDT